MNRVGEVKWISLFNIQPNPKNRNKHSEEQIDRLCEIIQYQGFRVPLVVSNRSGLLVAGHGRLLAAKKLKMDVVPVLYQDFDSEEQEYAAQVSDNAIASWAELDFAGINADLPALGPDFNLNWLGLKGFELEPADKLDPEKEWEGLPDFEAPEQQTKIIVIIDDESRRKEFLELISAKDYKEHKELLWSLHWPQKK